MWLRYQQIAVQNVTDNLPSNPLIFRNRTGFYVNVNAFKLMLHYIIGCNVYYFKIKAAVLFA